MRTLELGYSPCPNDTFIFHALTHGKIHGKTHGKLPGSACSGQLEFHERLEDVETLNYMALSGRLDITKVSFGVIAQVLDDYCLLRSGGALGRGCGPLVVAREPVTMRSLKGGTIAIPGANTTAFLLLKLFDPSLGENAVAMAFDLIMDAVKEGQVDAGLIIHEGRFTYKDYGLSQLIDLGQWWEETTGKPIPLGGMIAKRDLGRETLLQVEALIRESLSYAFKDPEAPMDYVRQNAQEMDESVMREHIKLYVNDFSLDLGSEGEDAVRELFRMARERGFVKGGETMPLFIE